MNILIKKNLQLDRNRLCGISITSLTIRYRIVNLRTVISVNEVSIQLIRV